MFSLVVEMPEAVPSGSTNDPGGSGEIAIDDCNGESVEFSMGNPRVEHITGVIHLYKKPDIGSEAKEPLTSQVCVLAVPADIGVQEFCLYCGPYRNLIKDMRFLRRERGRHSVYMVYLQFDNEETAQSFVADYNGKPFSPLEPEIIWKLVYVDRLEFTQGAPAPSVVDTELPTCPVCLERLDENISGVITTVCNHVFHNECLVKWGDTSCPVCRYCTQRSATSRCADCGTEEDLWICLICGHVGCGRYRSKHAVDHWQNTHHCYALELETQRVWDYVGDGYVHRLIQSKTDGKLVEVPAPGECSGSYGTSHEFGTDSKVDSEKEEAIVASKLDAIAFEYNHLLTAQLESQRQYFEGLMYQARIESEQRVQSACESVSNTAQELDNARSQVREAAANCKSVRKKMAEVEAEKKKVTDEKEFLKNLTENLIANQKEWQEKCKNLEQEVESVKGQKDAKIQDLEEQVRDLMIYLETQKMVKESGEELAGGSVLALPEAEANGQGQASGSNSNRRRTSRRRR